MSKITLPILVFLWLCSFGLSGERPDLRPLYSNRWLLVSANTDWARVATADGPARMEWDFGRNAKLVVHKIMNGKEVQTIELDFRIENDGRTFTWSDKDHSEKGTLTLQAHELYIDFPGTTPANYRLRVN